MRCAGSRRDHEALTAAAKSTIAFPAIWASSWLSLISMLIMWTGLLKSPPRVSRSGNGYRTLESLGGMTILTITHSIKASFFASYDNICYCFTFLPTLRGEFDSSVTDWNRPDAKHTTRGFSSVPVEEAEMDFAERCAARTWVDAYGYSRKPP